MRQFCLQLCHSCLQRFFKGISYLHCISLEPDLVEMILWALDFFIRNLLTVISYPPEFAIFIFVKFEIRAADISKPSSFPMFFLSTGVGTASDWLVLVLGSLLLDRQHCKDLFGHTHLWRCIVSYDAWIWVIFLLISMWINISDIFLQTANFLGTGLLSCVLVNRIIYDHWPTSGVINASLTRNLICLLEWWVLYLPWQSLFDIFLWWNLMISLASHISWIVS